MDFLPVSGKRCAKRAAAHPNAAGASKVALLNPDNRFDIFNNFDFPALECRDASAGAAGNAAASTSAENSARPASPSNTGGHVKSTTSLSSRGFCPPIFLENVNIHSLINQLRNRVPKTDFKIQNLSHSRSKLFLRDPIMHSEFMLALKRNKISSYSFTPKELRQVNVILRGLHCDVDIDETKLELNELAPGIVSDVKRFSTPFSRNNNSNTGLLLVSLSHGHTIRDVSKIKYLGFQAVRWEKPNSSSKVAQCSNCRRWGHLAKNCNRAFACIKCDAQHEPGSCKLVKTEDSKPYCVNCRDWGHPANYSGCPARRRFILSKQPGGAANNPGNRVDSKSIVRDNISFASHFHRGPARDADRPRSRRNSLLNEFLAVAEQILRPEPVSIESRIISFLNNLNSLSEVDKKNQCIALLNDVKNQYGI